MSSRTAAKNQADPPSFGAATLTAAAISSASSSSGHCSFLQEAQRKARKTGCHRTPLSGRSSLRSRIVPFAMRESCHRRSVAASDEEHHFRRTRAAAEGLRPAREHGHRQRPTCRLHYRSARSIKQLCDANRSHSRNRCHLKPRRNRLRRLRICLCLKASPRCSKSRRHRDRSSDSLDHRLQHRGSLHRRSSHMHQS